MNKTQRNPVVVQFFHPDPPYANKKEPNVKEWKVGPHTRNLSCMDNCKYVQKDGKLSGGKLAFWGEWEANGEIQIRKQNRQISSRVLFPHLNIEDAQKVFAQTKGKKGACEPKNSCGSNKLCDLGNYCNTDPFVFGSSFRYCNCHQDAFKTLRNLPNGSLILFGSSSHGTFCLDTVFVVKESISDWQNNREQVKKMLGKNFDIYSKVTLNFTDSNIPLTFYSGATFKEFDEMFSFSPAKVQLNDSIQSFEKLSLKDLDIRGLNFLKGLNPFVTKQTQGIHIILEGDKNIRNLWKRIRNFVLKKNLF